MPRKKKDEATPVAIAAIKGMNHDMTCRGYQFETGNTYTIDGPVKVCSSGFHACPADDETPPHAVFEYYVPGSSRYFDVTASGSMDRVDNKIASASITIGVEITMGELMRRVAEWCVKKAKGAASNSGNHGAASNSGVGGAASNSGYGGAAANSGNHGAASNSGVGGAASNSGVGGAASNSGYGGAAANSGNHGAASNSGVGGAASNSGDHGAASNSGVDGAALNSGVDGAAFSHAYGSKVMCEGDGQALYCTEFADDGEIASVACGITGREGIKAGVWYQAKAGKLVEVA
jgi:hypothetical protein